MQAQLATITASPLRRDDKEEMLLMFSELVERRRRRKIFGLFPETGPFRRELYPKQMQFFEKGRHTRQRLFMAANRVGKTQCGLYEVVMHATGLYPKWWKGRRFDRGVTIWCVGDTSKTVRDVLVRELLGPENEIGTGLIPADCYIKHSTSQGVRNSADTISVLHASGGTSLLTFKTYEEKRESFQGTEIDCILLDEEPPEDIFSECLMRTLVNGGLVMLTFTPLRGMTKVILSFFQDGDVNQPIQNDQKCAIMASWDDVPHIPKEEQEGMLASMPPFQRNARSKGIPQMGAGVVYPIAEERILVDPFVIPDTWKKVYGLDVGWNRTAAIFGAIDPTTDVLYLFHEHYLGEVEPVVHVQGIKGQGDWIPGVIDPASEQRNQKDGTRLIEIYSGLGLKLSKAFNGVDSGITDVWNRMVAGKLKVFRTCQNWLKEYRKYRRDEKGRIVKEDDHLMDATRYLVVSGLTVAKVKPTKVDNAYNDRHNGSNGWMG